MHHILMAYFNILKINNNQALRGKKVTKVERAYHVGEITELKSFVYVCLGSDIGVLQGTEVGKQLLARVISNLFFEKLH